MTKSEGDGRGGCGDVREKQLIGREGGRGMWRSKG